MISGYSIGDSISTVASTLPLRSIVPMDLISILWLLVGAGALIFTGDALMTWITRRGHLSPAHKRSALIFGSLMFLFALGTVALVVGERLL
jgi:uncharacterized iron-regulated membrane protein